MLIVAAIIVRTRSAAVPETMLSAAAVRRQFEALDPLS
jgi:hypothetical protein